MVMAGAAIVDITPPPGLAMAGFGARTLPATGAHDPLTARALAVGDTAIVVADVLGMHEEMSRRIRERCVLPAGNVVVTAVHNHGGPSSMAGRVGPVDQNYLRRLEDGCVEAIDRAVAAQQPARLSIGMGSESSVSKNRRHAGGIIDPAVPMLFVRGVGGETVAVLTSYASHPVVLGADNLLWTADYPHFVRSRIEAAHPGAVALFLTGCCGDANTGHSAYESQILAANERRTFATAERLGTLVAEAGLAAEEVALGENASAAEIEFDLSLQRRETKPLAQLADEWRAEAATADATRKVLLNIWTDWAKANAGVETFAPWRARVSVLDWGGAKIVALPGEIFSETGLGIRAALGAPGFVVCFAEGNPGYIPPASEFAFGGYEVDEAHRYYGMPASFAPGAAEAVAHAAKSLIRNMNSGRIAR